MMTHTIHHPVTVGVISLAVIVAGIFAMLHIPVELIPAQESGQLNIFTYYPGAPPHLVESDVTSLIEADISSMEGISKIKSISLDGYSLIYVDLSAGEDVDFICFSIQERLSFLQDQLPKSAYPPEIFRFDPVDLKSLWFMSYHIVSPQNEIDLKDYVTRNVIPKLNRIPGVAGSQVSGGRERQVLIRFDPFKLQQFNLFPQDIYNCLYQANQNQYLGSIRLNDKKKAVVLKQNIKNLYELESLPVLTVDSRIIRLRDLAEIKDTLSEYTTIERVNGQTTVLLTIYREAGYNVITTADHVNQALEQIVVNLPRNIRFIKLDDESLTIRETIHLLIFRSIYSFVIIFLVLVFFLRHISAALIIQSSVVISTCGTFLLMLMLNYSLNLVTLAGLSLGFGMLVDNSIVVMESIFLDYQKGTSAFVACTRSYREVKRPIIASTLTTIAALFPFVFLKQNSLPFYLSFAMTVSISLTFSLVTAFMFIPVATFSKCLSNHPSHSFLATSPGIESVVHRFYQKILRKALIHPLRTILIMIWLFGLPVWLLPTSFGINEPPGFLLQNLIRIYHQITHPLLKHLVGGASYLFYQYVDKTEFKRLEEETCLRVHIYFPPGSRIEELDKVVSDLEGNIVGTPGIDKVHSRIYSQRVMIEIHFNSREIYAKLPFQIKEKVELYSAGIGNAIVRTQGYGQGFFTGSNEKNTPFILELTGYNYRDLEIVAENLRNCLQKNLRVKNLQMEMPRSGSYLELTETVLRFKRDVMSDLGFTVNDVTSQVFPYLSAQLYNQRLRIGSDDLLFAIQSQEQPDFDRYKLKNLTIRNRTQQKISMGSVAIIENQIIAPEIQREDQRYFKLIAFDYWDNYVAAAQFVNTLVLTTSVPPGYTLKQLGGFFQPTDYNNLWLVACLAILFMYMVLAGLYESFSYPFIIFFFLPLSLIGVFFIYFFTGATFNQSAFIGVIFLMGITVNNAILLVDHIRYLIRNNPGESLHTLLVQAGTDRLRPILMTAITTITGLLPVFILADSQQKNNIWYVLSLSTIGGLISSVILGLIALPVLVLLLEKWKSKANRLL